MHTDDELFATTEAPAATADHAQAAGESAGILYGMKDTKERRNYRNTKGQKVDSVTQVTGVLDKPGLLYWAYSCGKEGISMDAAKKSAANIGTVAHARCEAWLRDLQFDSAGLDPAMVSASDDAVDRFKSWWEAQGFLVELCEYSAVSDELNLGGRCDIIARREAMDGPRVLIDLKTSKGFYTEMYLQVGGGYPELFANPHLTETASGLWVKAPELIEFQEVWLARIGKDEPGDMDAHEIAMSEVALLRKTFQGMALNHYNLKQVLSRHK